MSDTILHKNVLKNNIAGIYFSGTGNTKHCVEKLLNLLDSTAVAKIESANAVKLIEENEYIILGYPIQFSNLPVLVRDFINNHSQLWYGKKVICLVTMGLFSGDGAGVCARLLKKYGAEIVGGLHLNMPDSISDVKALKRSLKANRELIRKSDEKIERTAANIKNGIYPKQGLNIFSHILGLVGQRLWFFYKTRHYTNNLKFSDACIGCGLCVKNCPMHNLKLVNHHPEQGGQCTQCYQCVSQCPQQAITLLGKKVVEQCRFENYQ